VKFLSGVHHVSRSTVIAALRRLRQSGAITRIGRTHWVGGLRGLRHARRTGSVVMLLRDRAHLPTVFHSDRFAAAAYRALEINLARAGLALRFEYTWDLPTLYREWQCTRRFPRGLLLYDTNSVELPKVPLLRDSEPFARHTDSIPLVLDWAWSSLRPWRRNMYVFHHEETSSAVAQTIAGFVVDNGWRRVRVFVDDDGILASPGREWQFTNLLKLRTELLHRCARIDHRLCLVRRESAPLPAWDPSAPWRERAERELSRYVPTPFDSVLPEIDSADSLERTLGRPRDKEVWVFQRDSQAVEAIAWARARRIDVPRDVALIGLENDPSLYHHGLTRCDPDFESMGYLMAHALIGDFEVATDRCGNLPNRAYMVEKATTP
jgi:hypothetical protein